MKVSGGVGVWGCGGCGGGVWKDRVNKVGVFVNKNLLWVDLLTALRLK